MIRSWNTYIVLLCFVVVSCKPTRTLVARDNDRVYLVNLEHLIDNVSRYHGKTVQTTGLFNFGFEDQSLHPASAVFDSTKKQFYFRIKSAPGLWIEFESSTFHPDSARLYTAGNGLRLTTIQGVIDTLNTGHMGYYRAAIVKAKHVIQEE